MGAKKLPFTFDVDTDLDNFIGAETGKFVGEDGEVYDENFSAMGVDPYIPTRAKPGSEEKVNMLAARYAAGVPLWHDEDCYDHGPAEMNFMEEDHDADFDDVEIEEEI